MKKSVAKRWAKALRSGKYKQGQDYLKHRPPHCKTQYCCLGVLAEIEGLKFSGTGIKIGIGEDQYSREKWNLPLSFRHQIGMSEDDEKNFISLNDEAKITFNEIAKEIEKRYL